MSIALDKHRERLSRECENLDGSGLLRLAVQANLVADGLPSGDGPGSRRDALRVAGVLATMAAERSHETTWGRRDIVCLARRCLMLAGEGREADIVHLRFAHDWKVEPVDPDFMLSGQTGLRFVFSR